MSLSDLGYFGENLAVKFLKNRGYSILDQNFRRPWGEIDVICQKDKVIVFVEVKTNKKEVAGFEPESRVSHDKLQRMVRAARTYLLTKKYSDDQEWRLDVIAVTIQKEKLSAKIRHYLNVEA